MLLQVLPDPSQGARMQSRNLAARVGRWSAQHRKVAILGWLSFVILATVLGGKVGQKQIDESASGNGESKRGDMIVKAAGFPDTAGEQVLIQGKTSSDPLLTAAVKDVVARLQGIKGISDIESPLNKADRANTVSKDGRSVVVNFAMDGDADAVDALVDKPLAAVAAAQKANPGVRVEQFGEVSATKEIAAQDAKDGKRSEMLSYGITLLILLSAFGALVAAGMPLLLGATAVAGTMGLLGPVSQVFSLSEAVGQVVIVIGLAVGVDYAMFYQRRMMEEQDKGSSPEAALEIASATSGRAVMISGVTVMMAMAGMLFAGNPIFASFGIGTMVVVAMAMLGSLTFLPAMLSFLGRKGWLEKGRVPFVAKRRHKTNGQSRAWGAVLDRVLARPLLSVIAAGGLLVALTIPALGMKTISPGLEALPQDLPVMQTFDRIQAAFPGGPQPAMVVIEAADVTAAPVREGIARLREQALASGQMSDPITETINPGHTVSAVNIPMDGTGTD